MMLLNNMERVRHFFFFWVFLNLVVALHAVTNDGVGTGSFLGDENDLSLAVNMAIPYASYLGTCPGVPRRQRLLLLGAAILMTAAVVASMSRGGFVGFVLVVGGIVWFSRHRFRNGLAMIICAGIGLFFVPQDYIEEMETIGDTALVAASVLM